MFAECQEAAQQQQRYTSFACKTVITFVGLNDMPGLCGAARQ